MRVGIFDSGMGGLSVLHQAMRCLPNTEFVYYADKDHVPYGEKTEEQIKGFVEEILRFLIAQQVDAIVIACNTATVVATKEFRSRFPVPIVGIEPAVKKALEEDRELQKRILVTATPITIAGEKLHKLVEAVDSEQRVDLLALPELVRFAEKGEFLSEEIEAYLRRELQGVSSDTYGSVVLGCTHFNYFKEQFRKIFTKDVRFVDGNEGVVRQLMRVLPSECEESTSYVEYYISGRPANAEERAQIARYLEQLERVYEM